MFAFLTRRVLQPPAFGLDISDLSVKFVRLLWQGDRLMPLYFGETAVPAGVVESGEVKKPSELVAILRDGLCTAGGRKITERYCVASLPEEKSFVRMIQLPAMKAEDVPRAIRWEVEGVVPLPFDQIYFDYEEVPAATRAAPDRHDVFMTAFPRSLIESYQHVLREAGFVTPALELESQAISRAIVGGDLVGRPLIVVDLGATRTSFIIVAERSIVFTKSSAIGGKDFEAAIATALGVSLQEARQIKVDAGLNKNYENGRVFECLAPVVRAITAELEQQLVFYRDHPFPGGDTAPEIERIVLSGGDANLIGLEKFIAVTIKRPTTLGDPFVNLRFPPGTVPSIPRNISQKYTTAIGLALRAAGL